MSAPAVFVAIAGDGVYKHNGVPAKLEEHFGVKGIFTHDLMHKVGIEDTRMRNPKAPHAASFAWLNAVTQVKCADNLSSSFTSLFRPSVAGSPSYSGAWSGRILSR